MPELAVLVPVLNRPQNVAPLIESWRENKPACASMYDLVFLANEDDLEERRAFKENNVQGALLPNETRTWPQKINYGVTHITADWYLCAADDVRFADGWWEATEEARSRVGFIGTNDSVDGNGNPRVAAGIHTCHPLVSAEYVKLGGADGGPFCFEGVAHWYVDDILIETAKRRGQWEFVRDAVLIHNHPYWGRGEWDDTYTRGEANAKADEAAAREFFAKWLT